MATNDHPAGTEGRRVRDARDVAGLTQGELADRLGVAQSTVARWERGAVPMTLPQLRAIADALNVPSASLIPDCDIDAGGAAA